MWCGIKLIFTVAVLALLGANLGVFSAYYFGHPLPLNWPVPSARDHQSPPQEHAAGEDNEARDNQHGGDKSSINFSPTNTQQSSNPSSAKQDEESPPKRSTGDLLTGALVFATLLQFGALLWQGRQLKKSVIHGNLSAQAAKASSEIAQHILELSQRPWISLQQISIINPLVFSQDGISTTIQITVENIGHSPAFEVWLDVIFIPSSALWPSETEQRILSAQVRRHERGERALGYTIFPGQTHTFQQPVRIVPADIQTARTFIPNDETIVPTVVGCISYFGLTERQHQTGFVYLIIKLNPNCPSATLPIRFDDRNIPVGSMEVRESFLSNPVVD
jgi:hypothetical protein